jgi:ketosteroid isomerase-like protein
MPKASEYALAVPGFGRRPLVIAALAVGLALAGYELLPRDEQQITSLLNELCAKLNQVHDEPGLAELQQALHQALLPNASVRVTELDVEVSGADEITERARQQLKSGVPLSFALNSLEVHLSGRLARVDVDLLVTARGSGEQSRDLRHTHVRLTKSAAGWRIEAIDIDPVAASEPEARP